MLLSFRSGGWPGRHAAARCLAGRVCGLWLGLVLLVGGAPAGAATLDAEAGWFGRWLELTLTLETPAAYRVFILDGPPRLVVDLATDELAGLDPAGGPAVAGLGGVEVGRLPQGWSRLVAALGGPFAPEAVELDGRVLRLRLARVAATDFAARSGAPPGVWAGDVGHGRPAAPPPGDGGLVVAIDAGHGGVDPGAVAGGLEEKAVVLAFAEVLADRLGRDGMHPVLIRDGDVFLPLEERVARARAAGADILLSLHSNAVADPAVRGAIVFTRSDRSSNPEAAARALVENAADRAGGPMAAGLDPRVFSSLAQMSRNATDRRSAAAGAALVAALGQAEAGLSRYPRQSAAFVVLGAPDLPSVLLELGFLSSPEDRAGLAAPAWRLRAAEAVRRGLRDWAAAERGGPAPRPGQAAD